MRSIISRARGFSLIELVVYLAIFGVVSVYALLAIGDLFSIYSRIRAERRVAYAGEVAMERIIREIRKGITVSDSTLVINGTKLELDSIVITPNNVTVEGLVVAKPSPTERSSLVRVEFTVKSGTGRYEVKRIFKASAIPRTGY